MMRRIAESLAAEEISGILNCSVDDAVAPERGMALNDALRYYDEMVRNALGGAP
jgi:hypothetical protein